MVCVIKLIKKKLIKLVLDLCVEDAFRAADKDFDGFINK